MGKLDNRVAVITGGSGGIGRAAAKRFVDEGAKVLLVDLEERAMRSAVDAIGGDHASFICADVTSDDDTQRYVKTAVERYGRLDIYLANAGIEGNVKPIPDYPLEVFDRVIAVNVRGVWLGLKYVIPAMAKGGGGSRARAGRPDRRTRARPPHRYERSASSCPRSGALWHETRGVDIDDAHVDSGMGRLHHPPAPQVDPDVVDGRRVGRIGGEEQAR